MAIQHRPHTQRKRLHLKWILCFPLPSSHQALPKQTVHRPLERVPGLPNLLLNQLGQIVVNGESCSHIMMLDLKTS